MRKPKCPACKGSGWQHKPFLDHCKFCRGKGYARCQREVDYCEGRDAKGVPADCQHHIWGEEYGWETHITCQRWATVVQWDDDVPNQVFCEEHGE